jgi:hypothetical protein
MEFIRWLLGSGIGGFFLYLAKAFYENNIKNEIHSAKIAANASQTESRLANENVIATHSSLNRSLTKIHEDQARLHSMLLEVKAVTMDCSYHVERLTGLSAQLAKEHLQLKSEIVKLSGQLILIKDKK